jgi:hypothetical protein
MAATGFLARRPFVSDTAAPPLRSVAVGALLCLGWTLVGTLSFSRQYFDNPRYLQAGGALASSSSSTPAIRERSSGSSRRST